jgi:hypothetical protein
VREEKEQEEVCMGEMMEAKPGAANPNWMLPPFTQHFPGHVLALP